MKYRFVIILLIVICSLTAQTIRQMEHNLPSEQNQQRLEMLQKIASHYAATDPKKSANFYIESLQTARYLKDESAEAIILQELGILNINRLGNYQMALENFLASLEIIRKLENKRNLANAFCNVAVAYEFLGKNNDAIRFNEDALQAATVLNEKSTMALAENNLGNIYSRTAHYDKALKSYFHALQLKEEIGEDTSIILNNIGIIYEQLDKITEALEFHRRAIAAKKLAGASEKSIATSLTNLGNNQLKLGNLEEATNNHQEALVMRRKLNDTEGIALSLQNIGTIYVQKKEYEKALSHFQEALDLHKQLKNSYRIVGSYIEISNIQMILNHFNEAEKMLLEAEKLAIQINANDYLINIYEKLNTLSKEKKDFQAALHYNEKMINVKEQIVSLEKTRSIIEMTTKFDTKQKEEKIVDLEKTKEQLTKETVKKEKQLQVVKEQSEEQERQIVLLEKEKEILEKEREINELQIKNTQLELINKELAITRITNQRMYFGIVLLLTFLLAVTFYNQYRSKKKDVENLKAANMQIQLQNKKLEDLYLTENQLVKKLEELNATKNKFFSIIAHDLKNGFSSLLSGSKLLTTHIDNMEKETIKEIAEGLKNSTDTLFNLLQNLLQWSRIQTGRIENKPEELPLYMLIQYNLRMLRNAAEAKNISLIAEVDENKSVWADKNMLNSVIQNIVYNALKFTNPGGEVKIIAIEGENTIQISVQDNGVGMTEKTKNKLFKIDEHITNRGTKNEQGTGLGLLLCKEFIEKNQGKIWIVSEEGKGTSVCFTLPKTKEGENYDSII